MPLADILAEAGVQPGADQLKSTSIDGWTSGTPVAAIMDGRDAMLAFAMNGEPLPTEHGFPVRMVVPGLYGFVSATKWVVDLELTTFDDFDAYWATSRLGETSTDQDAVAHRRAEAARASRRRPVGVGGVAWAQHRGITPSRCASTRVPGSRPNSPTEQSIDTWRQWTWTWDATPGNHRIEVRATDADGDVQPGRACRHPSRTARPDGTPSSCASVDLRHRLPTGGNRQCSAEPRKRVVAGLVVGTRAHSRAALRWR